MQNKEKKVVKVILDEEEDLPSTNSRNAISTTNNTKFKHTPSDSIYKPFKGVYED